MPFSLHELKYDYNALKPCIDAQTVEIQYNKLLSSYITQLYAALEKYPEFFDFEVVSILSSLSKIPEDIRTTVRNNGRRFSHYN